MTIDPSEITPRLEVALRAAQEAGRITLKYFRCDGLEVQRKRDDSPVTIADREAEQQLRSVIAAAFPGDGILGEEFPEQAGASGFRWILDPIDGTKSFIHGVPLYGTLVGLEHSSPEHNSPEQNAQSVLGVILIPALDECVYAARGQGAWYVAGGRPPRRARVSSQRTLASSLFLTSEVGNFNRIGRAQAYERLQAAARLSRTWGDCYGHLMVATGRAEVMVDPLMEIWDGAALPPILEEAGGTFTDWQGRRTIYSGNGLATNGLVLDEVMAITRG